MPDNVPITAGTGTNIATDDVAGNHFQRIKLDIGGDGVSSPVVPANPLPVRVSNEGAALFRGRVSTFRTLGRAGTTGQKLLSIWNAATGTPRVITINQLFVDMYVTVVKAVTVAPPIIRLHRLTAAPTNGTVLTKVAKDTLLSSHANVEIRGDASADGTGSATTLTATIGAGTMLSQEVAPRLITAAGYEMFDRTFFLENADIVLRGGEGIVLFLDYTAAGSNPVTDMWFAGVEWYETAA